MTEEKVDVPEKAGVKTDMVEIQESVVIHNNEEYYLIVTTDSDKGVAVRKVDVDLGLVKKEAIYDFLLQEWLNNNYGVIPKKKLLIEKGGNA